MIRVHASNGITYKFPEATDYKFGEKTIKLYKNGSHIGNFVVENMDAVTDSGRIVKKEGNSNAA